MTDHLTDQSEHLNESELFSSIRQRLHTGIGKNEFESFNNQVIREGLLVKSAYYYSDSNALPLQIPAQWLKPEIKELIATTLELGFDELVVEFCRFISKYQLPFPADSLLSILNHALKNQKFALKVLHSIGPKGRFLTEHFNQWKILHPESAENFFAHPKKELRLFCFRRYRQAQAPLAFQQFLNLRKKIKSTELPDFLLALKAQLSEGEFEKLEEYADSKSKHIQFAWTVLKLSQNPIEFQKDKNRLHSIYNQQADFLKFTFLSRQNKAYQWPAEMLVSCIPPDFISPQDLQNDYYNFILEHSLEQQFCDALAKFPDLNSSNSFFEFVLKKHLLKENFPTTELFRTMDHESFNANCIKWIMSCGDQLDVEAFLQVCLLDNQYWSDELCIRIMELRKSKPLSEIYEFDAFWQLLPFKMNPGSDLCTKIPEECSYFENEEFNFKLIIQFRKWLRTIKLNTA